MKIVRDIDLKKWQKYINEEKNSTIFHTPYMCKVYERDSSKQLYKFFMVDDGGEIHGLAVIYIHHFGSKLLGNILSRAVSMASILGDDRTISMLVSHIDLTLKGTIIYTQVRNSYEPSKFTKNTFSQNDYLYEKHLEIVNDLRKNEDTMWKELNRAARKHINKANKCGLTFEKRESLDDMHKCYSILEDVYSRVGMPLQHFNHFKELYNCNNQQNLVMLCVYYQDKIISCQIGLVYKKMFFAYYAGSLGRYLNLYPNDFLYWNVMLWAKNMGLEELYWGGAGKADVPYGVRDYKMKFGGNLVEFGRFEKINKPILFMVGNFVFSIKKKILKKRRRTKSN